MTRYYTEETEFFGDLDPKVLVEKYGSPLYVYNEKIFREKIRDMKNIVSYDNFIPNYSIKANSNLHLLKIVRDEGIYADAMSPGEVYVLKEAGFKPEQIFYVSNNVSDEEMQYAIDNNIIISIDSLSQLERYGKLNKGGKVAIRFNPGVGAGHHEKVITGGKKTKFGINLDCVDQVKEILKKYDLRLVGINQHIGSLFLEIDPYIKGVESLLSIAKKFNDLEFIDLGGGFGIQYMKQQNKKGLDLKDAGTKLDRFMNKFAKEYGKNIMFKTEPGRYIAAESCVLLGTVHSRKSNYGNIYIGTDLGFNVLIRPTLYDSHHDIEVYRDGKLVKSEDTEIVNVVGNICETGDVLAKKRELSKISEEDIIGVMDAGAYGYSMSSNYNNRLRPAEVLIEMNGNDRLIRRRDTLEDLVRNF